ncbi:MAG: hypothetical protein EOM64_08845 [Erysipelotrichia bacterium]|nr:hypothetical protein [Erysipelotrichia bacterium]
MTHRYLSQSEREHMKNSRRLILIHALLALILDSACVVLAETDAEQNSSVNGSDTDQSHLTVRPAETLDSINEVKDNFTDLSYREFWINSKIPVLEAAAEDISKSAPIVFFLHGITGSKEQEAYILSRFAEEGYRAVSFDLPGHGERTDGSYMFLDVVEQGMKDLTLILDYYAAEHCNTSHYALGGFSTGAIIAYGMTGVYHPDVLIAASGVSDWNDLQESSLLDRCYESGQQIEPVAIKDTELEELYECNPFSSLSNLKNTAVIISHGLEDTTFDYTEAVKTAAELKKAGNTRVSLNLYETAHSITAGFIDLMIELTGIYLPLTAGSR